MVISVKDVNPEDDYKKFQENYNFHLERQAQRDKGPIKTMQDFKPLIEDLEKRKQVLPTVDWHREVNNWEQAEVEFKGVHWMSYDRDKREFVFEVDHEDLLSTGGREQVSSKEFEHRYIVTLQNVHELEAHDPSDLADITVARHYGGDRPLEIRDFYFLEYYENRGKCTMIWEKKGSYTKGSPNAVQGFAVHCRGMTPFEYYEAMQERWKKMATWSDDCPADPVKCARITWMHNRRCAVDPVDDLGPEADEARRKEKEREAEQEAKRKMEA